MLSHVNFLSHYYNVMLSRDPLNFWALNANRSKTVRATDFKFDVRVSSGSPYMTP